MGEKQNLLEFHLFLFVVLYNLRISLVISSRLHTFLKYDRNTFTELSIFPQRFLKANTGFDMESARRKCETCTRMWIWLYSALVFWY